MDLSTTGLVLVLLALAWYYLKKPHKFWADRGVIQTNPWLLLGDIGPILFRQKSTSEWLQYIYNLAPNSRYVGCYNFNLPILMLRNPQLIKQVAIKDFNNFSDHPDFADPNNDPLWGKNLFALKGDKWRKMRHTMSPTFSSGKVKVLYELITEQSDAFVKYFQNNNSTEVVDVDVKDATSRFANDVIASTAFGLNVNSLKNRDNEFFRVGRIITNFSGFLSGLKFIALQYFPSITNLLGLKFFDEYSRNYFYEVISDTIKSRKEKNIVRPDVVNILLEASKESSKQNSAGNEGKNSRQVQISHDDIASQGIIFLFAGFQTVSTALSFVTYELALNKDIQDKLRDEIKRNAVNGTVSYEVLQNMPYMDMVVSESLRKWPVVPYLDRICNKPYTIKPEKDGERPLTIPKGTEVWFPVYPIQRDPNYYPDPEKFDPERFSPENRSKIPDYVYHPFGCGPRICIGSRFALIEMKALLFKLLLNFEILTTAKTRSLVLGRGKEIHMSIDGGKYLLGFKPIK